MNSKERFYGAMEYKGFDRMPVWHMGTPEINRELMEYFGISTYEELQIKLGDDFRQVDPKFIGPSDILKIDKDGTWKGLWGEKYFNNINIRR